MPTMLVRVGDDPVALALDDGQLYAVQNATTDAVIFWASAATKPPTSHPAFRLAPGEKVQILDDFATSGELAWAWTAGEDAALVLTLS